MNSERGNREWLNDYPSLKQVKSNNPFTVPDGYFNELELQITSLVKLDELKNEAASQGFIVPENYFDELRSNIQARIKIEEVLNKETAGHTAPSDYFENLSQQIQSRIMIEEALCEPTEIFAVPQDYFEQLSQNILNKTVNQENLKQEGVKKKGVVRQLFASTAFKYATAACITLAVGASVFLSQNGSNPVEEHNNSFLHKSLSAIPVDEIKNYLKDNIDQTDTRTLIDDSKQVNADNLSNDLQDELDTSQ